MDKLKEFEKYNINKLGFGLMRLPEDKVLSKQLIDTALDSGVNYFDTAYIYNNNEKLAKELFKDIPREKYYLADKLPFWNCSCDADVEKFLNESLERTGAKYFDFYLVHSMSNSNNEAFEKYNPLPYLRKKQKDGIIKSIGFSFHGNTALLKKLVSENEFDFAQIQLNYYDEFFDYAVEKYEILEKVNLPVIVMEGVRGGMLANLGENANSVLKNANPSASIASWAFRWLFGFKNVKVILSGMNTEEQLQENLELFNKQQKLTPNEKTALDKAIDIIKGKNLIPCTSCGYCKVCSKSIDIPLIFKIINDHNYSKTWQTKVRIENLPETSMPFSCTKCGACEKMCPQNIKIVHELSLATQKFKQILGDESITED